MFFYLIFDIKRQFFVFLKIFAVFGKKSIFNACLLAEEYTVRRTFVKSIFFSQVLPTIISNIPVDDNCTQYRHI